MTIFDLIKADATVSFWNEISEGMAPYLGEELVTKVKQKSTSIRMIKGASGAPVSLKLSAYDAKAVSRGRIGFETAMYEMPFFKESMYIDEKLQKELNEVLATGNQAYIDAVTLRIMNDNVTLLSAARLSREIMMWQALTSGAISIVSNGQAYELDYGVPSNHKGTVVKSWSDITADIISDVTAAQDIIEADTGVRPTRMVVSRPTFNNMTRNSLIKKTVFSAGSVDAYLGATKLKEYFMAEVGVDVVVYDKRYPNALGTSVKFIPDDVAVLLPDINLGEMTFGETPEESNSNAGIAADISITDIGVAVTTMAIADPVTVETKVSMACIPSLPHIDKIFILDNTVA